MAEMKVPDWLSADFLQKSLETDIENFSEISISNYSVEPAVPPGNNYGSQLFRVKIQYRRQGDSNQHSISLILKAPLVGGIIKDLEESGTFLYKREVNYYNKFLSETYKLTKHNTVPKHYTTPNPLCVLMEDLKSSGYLMVDRHKLLDFDHCQLYIKASAQLHALSVAVNKNNPDVIQSLRKEDPDFKKSVQEMSKGIMFKALRSMVAYLEDKSNCENYVRVINLIIDNFSNFWKTYQEMEEELEVRLKAIVQVDPWCTNMMFKYNTFGKVTDIKILDFQNLKYTTPVSEFITFFWLSVRPEVQDERRNNLYHLYCDSFNNNLEKLGCSERLSFEDFTTEIAYLSPLVLMLICSMLPFCINDGVVDLNTCLTEDISNKNIKETSFYQLYTGVAFNSFYPQILHQAAKLGVFQYIEDTMFNSSHEHSKL